MMSRSMTSGLNVESPRSMMSPRSIVMMNGSRGSARISRTRPRLAESLCGCARVTASKIVRSPGNACSPCCVTSPKM
jgi:hypothetical protein